MTCRSGIGMYQSYGGDTAFAMPKLYDEIITGSDRKWDFSRFIPDVVVIELGANDLSSHVDSVKFTRAYLGFLEKLRGHYRYAKIVCLSGPESVNDTLRNRRWVNLVKGAATEASKSLNNIYYFGLGTIEYNGSDWHPSAAEHKKLSNDLTVYLRKLMNWPQ